MNQLENRYNIFIESKSSPICDVPEMAFGNMPADGGQLLLTDEEKSEFLFKEPQAQEFIKPCLLYTSPSPRD